MEIIIQVEDNKVKALNSILNGLEEAGVIKSFELKEKRLEATTEIQTEMNFGNTEKLSDILAEQYRDLVD